MNWLVYFLGALIAYLVGSINSALIVCKIKKKDIAKEGTQNLGASNATIVLGLKWGVFVGAFDIFKGFIVVFLARMLFKDFAFLPYIAATCAILGHIFPFYHKFKGGKGFATLLGSVLGYNIIAFAAAILLTVLITVITDYIALATLTVALVFPIFVGFYTGNPIYSAILAISSLIIFHKHRVNIKKIIHKEEIGLRQALFKKDKKN